MLRCLNVLLLSLLVACVPQHQGLIDVKVISTLARASSGTITLADGASTTISHGAPTTVPIVEVASIQTTLSGTLVANWATSVNADTGQTGTPNNGAAISAGWLELDGTNDYLTFPDDASYTLGASDFTIEFDFRVDTVSGAHHIVNHAGPGELYAWAFVMNGSTLLCFAGSSTNRDVLNDVALSTSIATATTYQVALVRSGNSFYGYLNGSKVFTQTSSASILNPSSAMVFGRPSSVSTEYLDGRVRRFRMTVGTARYTGSSYTPPATDFAGEQTKTHLRIGTDYTATTSSTGTTITNTSGSSKDISASIYY